MRDRHHVVVIGAGISGLSAAHFLKKRGIRVTVLERSPEAGGVMKSSREDGWLIEAGPNSVLETTPLLRQLAEDTRIADKMVYANASATKRYIAKDGRLHPLPAGIGSFLTSRLLSVGGKLRLLKEPWIGRARSDESIAEFARRRVGRECLDYIVNPFVAGIYAGDPGSLSIRSSFPKLFELEQRHGGLLRGVIHTRRERKRQGEPPNVRARSFSFQEGISSLPLALADGLGTSIIYDASVEHVIPMRAGSKPVYTITYMHEGTKVTMDADAVVFASPADATARIIRLIDPEMAKTLESIVYAPVAEVFLGFEPRDVGQPLDGFGFLVPEVEGKSILGCIWSSTLFPGRASGDNVALTTFVGGTRQPELLQLSDERLVDLVRSDLVPLMKLTGKPIYSRITRCPRAIPQYILGYHKTEASIDRFELNFRGAFICSNYRGGISMGDCVMSAEKMIARIEQHLS